MSAIRFAMARRRAAIRPTDYGVTNTSERVVNFILSTAHQHQGVERLALNVLREDLGLDRADHVAIWLRGLGR